ncbi:hypothetical protein JCM5350_006108 [Sporobolomyces pararoseus]
MFKRPHSSKTTTPIRSSDLRKLREELSTTFPSSSSNQLTKDSLKLLLPDGSLIGKATTHLDEPITIYYSPNSDPRFFRIGKGNEGKLIPTCYSFDALPSSLLGQENRLETAEQVVDNLQSGSALFLAGVSKRSLSNLPDSIKKGDLVSIVVYDQPQLVVAVGQLANTKQELLKEFNQDKKGKAVITLHARGDYLWQTGSTKSTQAPPPTSIQPQEEEPETESLSTNLATTSLVVDDDDDDKPEELTPSQVDQILYQSILFSISQLSQTSYPIPASSFYSSQILPNRPASTPSVSVDLKKSSYKKLSGLIKFATKKGWLVSKEVRGELVIMSGNKEHEDVCNLRSYKTVQMLEQQQQQQGGGGGGNSSSNGVENGTSSTTTTAPSTTTTEGTAIVNEYFKPSSTTLKQFLSLIPHSRPPSDLYLSHSLKQLFLSYLTNNHLVHKNSQKHFLILENPSLSLEDISHQELLVSLLLKKGEKVEELSKEGVMTKDEGFKRFLSNGGFTEYWGLSISGSDSEEVVQKGKPPMIRIQIKNVGKRQVTLISGHEIWLESISSTSSEQFSEELKHKTASSVSLQPVQGSAKKNQTPKIEIMCQGTHDKLVMGLLSSKGVPKKYIEVDTTKSKK